MSAIPWVFVNTELKRRKCLKKQGVVNSAERSSSVDRLSEVGTLHLSIAFVSIAFGNMGDAGEFHPHTPLGPGDVMRVIQEAGVRESRSETTN